MWSRSLKRKPKLVRSALVRVPYEPRYAKVEAQLFKNGRYWEVVITYGTQYDLNRGKQRTVEGRDEDPFWAIVKAVLLSVSSEYFTHWDVAKALGV